LDCGTSGFRLASATEWKGKTKKRVRTDFGLPHWSCTEEKQGEDYVLHLAIWQHRQLVRRNAAAAKAVEKLLAEVSR
jgi:hypothetical protein